MWATEEQRLNTYTHACLIITIKKTFNDIYKHINSELDIACPGNNKRRREQKVSGYDLKVKQFYGAPEGSGNFSVNIWNNWNNFYD